MQIMMAIALFIVHVNRSDWIRLKKICVSPQFGTKFLKGGATAKKKYWLEVHWETQDCWKTWCYYLFVVLIGLFMSYNLMNTQAQYSCMTCKNLKLQRKIQLILKKKGSQADADQTWPKSIVLALTSFLLLILICLQQGSPTYSSFANPH